MRDLNFSAIVDCAPYIITVVDTDGTVLFLNRTEFNKDRGSFIGKRIFDTIAPGDHESVRNALREARVTGIPQRFINSVLIDGALNWYENQVSTLDPGSQDSDLVIFSSNITSQKVAEGKLQESEVRYRQLVEHSPDTIVIHCEGKIVYINRAGIRMLGGESAEEILGRSALEFVHPDDRIKVGLRIMEAMQQGIMAPTMEERFLLPGNRLVDVEVTGIPLTFLKKPAMQVIIRDITASKEAQRALRASESRLSAFLEFAPSLILIKDHELRPVFANKKLYNVFPMEDWLGKTPQEIFPEEVARQMVEKDTEALEKGYTGYEESWADKTGQSHTYFTEKFRIDNPDGPPWLGAVITDVTEKKSVENALRETEELFSQFLKKSPIYVFFKDEKIRSLKLSANFEEMLGRPMEELLGKNMDELFPSDFAKKIVQDDIRVLNEGKEVVLEEHFNGRTYSTIKFPIHMEGRPRFLAGFNIDITDRKKAEEDLRKLNEQILVNNERLESLVTISHFDAAAEENLLEFALEEALKLTQSKIGYIFFYNEKNQQFILNAWSKEAMKECTVLEPQIVYDLTATGCWGEPVRQRRAFIMNEYRPGMEFVKGTPDGHVRLEKFMSIPVFAGEEIVAVVGVANRREDYTQTDANQLTLLMDSMWKMVEKIRTRQELIQAKEKAEQSDRLKTAFLANMSHEIRTPMNAIVGFAGMLSDLDLSAKDRKQYSTIIQSRSDDLMHLINDLLEISRIESGSVIVVKERVFVNALVDEMESVFRARLKNSKKSHLLLTAEKPLSDSQPEILTDRYILTQVVSNLLDNAIKYTDAGAIRFGYHSPENGMITFFVTDTGIGISPENQRVIFEHFRQADIKDPHLYGGAGLGLSICKGSLTLLGSDIRVESEPGKGSTFFFSLAYEREPGDAKMVESAIAKGKSDHEYQWHGRKILLVEDEETNMEFLKIILLRTGADLVPAINGKEVRNEFNSLDGYDLVLMDVRLPDASGWDLTAEIKRIRPDLPVIAQTAYAMSTDKQNSEEAGCDNYLSKPIRKEKILEMIADYLG